MLLNGGAPSATPLFLLEHTISNGPGPLRAVPRRSSNPHAPQEDEDGISSLKDCNSLVGDSYLDDSDIFDVLLLEEDEIGTS
jgi:hypothetical protein